MLLLTADKLTGNRNPFCHTLEYLPCAMYTASHTVTITRCLLNYNAFIYKVLCQHSKVHPKCAVSALLELTNLQQTLSVKTEPEMKMQTESSARKNKWMPKKRVVSAPSPSRKLDTYVCF